MRRLLIILPLLLIFCNTVDAQQVRKKKLFKTATKAFDEGHFTFSLSKFLQYDSLYPGDAFVNYGIGACYLNTRDQKDKAIPYIEYAMDNMEDMPIIVYKQMGNLYYKQNKLENAENMYKYYLEYYHTSDAYIENRLDKIKFRQNLSRDSLKVTIENIFEPINTLNSEIRPYVSADETKLVYQEKETNQIFIVQNKIGTWSHKQKIILPQSPIDTCPVVNLAGISPLADEIFLELGNYNNTDIYFGYLEGNICKELFNLGSEINTPYNEGMVSLSIDGQQLYFSSNRPESYGLYDIYVSQKQKNGSWGKVQNLGDKINTIKNEKFPFIDANNQMIYFSSDGHQTVGGYDIFTSTFTNNQWEKAKNIGYPINSVIDELGFSITGEKNAAYFSSSRKDITLHYDIYKVLNLANLKNSLTLIKGKILGGIPPKPISTSIKLFDFDTKERLKYVYHSNPKTGNYLLLFPSGKKYSMHLAPLNFNQYVIDFFVPKQTRLTENFQEIYIKPAYTDANGETIEEEIIVNNHFSNTDVLMKEKDWLLRSEKYNKLLNLVETLVEATDSLSIKELDTYAYELENAPKNDRVRSKDTYDHLFNIIEEAIETGDATTLKTLSDNAIPDVAVYSKIKDQQDILSQEVLVYGKDTIKSIRINNNIGTISKIEDNKVEDIHKMTLFYEHNSLKNDNKADILLSEIANFLNQNNQLTLMVVGNASPTEGIDFAKNRTKQIVDFFADHGLETSRIEFKSELSDKFPTFTNQKVSLFIIDKNKTLAAVDYGDLVPPVNFTETEEYRIQVLIGNKHLKKNDSFFRGNTIAFYTQGKIFRYVIEKPFYNEKSANMYRSILQKKGFKDAFVVKFINGKRID